jgi:SAM-dependent methyltransferase
VLDAGCGGGRWTVALLRLGARVTAIDVSEAALQRTRGAAGQATRLRTIRANVLALPDEITGARFDMVFSFGVLHHTGETLRALRNVARLVHDDGLLCLYLYGADSWSWSTRLRTDLLRLRLASVPFADKVEYLKRRFPERDVHQCFDLLSPTINERLTFDAVARELAGLGFSGVTRTVDSTELFVRAHRPGFAETRSLLDTPVAEPLFRSHYAAVERLRRDLAHERGRWRLAGSSRRCPARAVTPLLDVLRLAPDGWRDRRLLVVSPDAARVREALDASGARTTYLAVSDEWRARCAPGLATIPGSTLDDAGDADERYDVVAALDSALVLSRHPDRAVRGLASRLRPGGCLVIETLAPDDDDVARRMRRLVLKPFSMGTKLRILRVCFPGATVAATLARLSPRLPIRLDGPDLHALLTRAGLEHVAVGTHDGSTVALGHTAGAGD